MRALGHSRAELGIVLVTDREIAALNRRYMGRTGPTDVLSFPMESREFLGDIVVSLDTAAVQVKGEGRLLREQVMILIVHGVLHLLGYDHAKIKDRARMREKEQKLCHFLGIGRKGLL